MHRLALCLELPTGSAPDWVELIPAADAQGKVTGRDGRSWTWDAEAQRDVLGAYASRAIALVIDRDHASEIRAPQGEEAPAAAWIEQLEIRDGALWGRAEWTDRGRAQVEAREYRYLSPVFDYVTDTGRIARLVSAGLVNKPNLYLTALNTEDHNMSNKTLLTAAIAGALGLSSTATEEDGVAAIGKLKTERETALNRELPSLDKYVPRADYDAMVTRATNAEAASAERAKKDHETAVNAEIDAALKAGKITPASVDYHRASCADAAGLERFREFAKSAPEIAGAVAALAKKPPATDSALNSEELAVIAATGISREQFLAARDAQAAAA